MPRHSSGMGISTAGVYKRCFLICLKHFSEHSMLSSPPNWEVLWNCSLCSPCLDFLKAQIHCNCLFSPPSHLTGDFFVFHQGRSCELSKHCARCVLDLLPRFLFPSIYHRFQGLSLWFCSDSLSCFLCSSVFGRSQSRRIDLRKVVLADPQPATYQPCP